MNRELYPDFLRAVAIARIVTFHFFGWQLLTYLPSLGIMFALGGWFVANSLNKNSGTKVIVNRLFRLMPTWWAFALLTLVAGFFYAVGANESLQPTFAWLFPYQQVTWHLKNDYANDATSVTWYIAAYFWLLLLSPVLLHVYKRLSWALIFAPVIVMIVYTRFHPYQDTTLGETWYNVLAFGGCWILGFAKSDGSINNVPRYLIWSTAIVCVACGVFMTYDVKTMSDNPVALTVLSFGVAILLLSFNPDLSFLPVWLKKVIRTINTFAVTIYLFHNILIDVANKIGGYTHVYELGNHIGLGSLCGYIGNAICFIITIVLIYVTTKTIGIVETHNWRAKAV